MSRRLKGKQLKFVKAKIEGHTNGEAVRIAGYHTKSKRNDNVLGYKMAHKGLIMEALDTAGMSDKAQAETLVKTIEAGVGIKATNSDAIAGLRLVAELKGQLKKDTPDSLTQNNIYINELKTLDDTALGQKLQELTQAVTQL
jgi:hypothetical protein